MPTSASQATLPFHPPRTHTLRGQRVILDSDLARLYGVPTKRLNEKVRRHPGRFPPDFAFLMSSAEWESVRADLRRNGQPPPRRKYLPYAFTECGALMAAGLLKSRAAIEVSIFVARASLIWGDS